MKKWKDCLKLINSLMKLLRNSRLFMDISKRIRKIRRKTNTSLRMRMMTKNEIIMIKLRLASVLTSVLNYICVLLNFGCIDLHKYFRVRFSLMRSFSLFSFLILLAFQIFHQHRKFRSFSLIILTPQMGFIVFYLRFQHG